jgi:CubicO group peptidase (beta-lactamase class C family)
MGMSMFREYHGYGLGLAVVTKESENGSIPCAGSIGSVGWPGAYGGWWSADPNKKTISIFLTHSMATPKQLAQGIGFELYEAIDIFSNYSKRHT